MEYLRGNKNHPKDIRARVRDGKHYRPPEWAEGSYGPQTTLMVSQAELDIAGHLLELVDAPTESVVRNRGSSGAQTRGAKKAAQSGADQPEV